MADQLEEIERIEKLRSYNFPHVEFRVLSEIEVKDKKLPIYGIRIGSEDKSLPTLALIGGVHGLERVGAQTVLAYLESLFQKMSWDCDLVEDFKNVRIVSVPVVNPAGIHLHTRSNPNGVDLMRNAPVEADGEPPYILGGHRISPKLPYYRGVEGAPMEKESQALVDYMREETFDAEAALIIDVHSGFGLQDRMWYPYAKGKDEFPQIKEVGELNELLDRSYPNHIYLVEPQSLNYTTHGDLWDYVFDLHAEYHEGQQPLYIPWTLEMGSWLWVKKNPLQFFSAKGMFNPIKVHRYRRTMRRHLPLFDFFLRAVRNHKSWAPDS